MTQYLPLEDHEIETIKNFFRKYQLTLVYNPEDQDENTPAFLDLQGLCDSTSSITTDAQKEYDQYRLYGVYYDLKNLRKMNGAQPLWEVEDLDPFDLVLFTDLLSALKRLKR